MCCGSSLDFKDSFTIEHLVATIAPFEIFSFCDSSELTMLNEFGTVDVDLVPPYQYLTLTCYKWL
ncbi:hypothetical protein Syun_014168 [Stephania yunnanensis]|uniref:Uncharacterized protein n=1 Tax=Stephania yunnanensis TaxID=152371 RepID=A0AAP0JKH8_9MAGN